VFGALKRAVGGGSLFMTEYRANGSSGMVAFATKVPGHILPIEVGGGNEYLIHRGGYLCGDPGVELSIAFQQKLGAGVKNVVFGAEVLFLAALTGPGKVWLQTLPLPNLASAINPYIVHPEAKGDGGGGIHFGSDND
jgi:uncharacterized protein (AIM24 family)